MNINDLYAYMKQRRYECIEAMRKADADKHSAETGTAADLAYERWKVLNSRCNLYQELLEIIRTGEFPS